MNSLSVTGQRFCEMPLDIDLANDQLKLWDYKLLESVHTPIHDANASHGMQPLCRQLILSRTHISDWLPVGTR